MYPGAIPMNTAARRPADWDVVISLVKKYAESAVSPEKAGARRTQMFLISTGMVRKRSKW